MTTWVAQLLLKAFHPKNAKVENFLGQIRMPNTVKQVKLIGFVQFGFVQFSRNFIPNL